MDDQELLAALRTPQGYEGYRIVSSVVEPRQFEVEGRVSGFWRNIGRGGLLTGSIRLFKTEIGAFRCAKRILSSS